MILQGDAARSQGGVRRHRQAHPLQPVEIVNLKQDLMIHKSDNRKDFETLRNEIHTDTREILMRMDEIWREGKGN